MLYCKEQNSHHKHVKEQKLSGMWKSALACTFVSEGAFPSSLSGRDELI